MTSSRIFEIFYGGDGKFSNGLGRYLVLQNQDVTLLAASGSMGVKYKHLTKNDLYGRSILDTTVSARGIKVRNPPYWMYALSRLLVSIQWVIKISWINARHPVTLIHAQDTGYSGLAAVISGKIFGIPVVISSHGIRHKVIESYIQGRYKNLLLKVEYYLDTFTIKKAKKVIAVNPSVKKYFENLVHRNIDFIPIPINVKKFEFSAANRQLVRNELAIDNETVVIGFVGRLEPVKNLHTLLGAFSSLAKADAPIKLVLVGTGQLENRLRDSSNKLGIGNKVIFCGARNDINKVLSSFDIFVLPSFIEGLSMALLEAMACSRAIICSDIPSNHEVASHNENALIFDPNNARQLEDFIRLLCNEKSLRVRLGGNAKKVAERYDESKVFPTFLQYYARAIKES